MNSYSERIAELGMKKYCCSQIMIILGLEIQGKTNPDLVQAAAGLCGGLYSGGTCGIISGAACLLSLFDKDTAATCMIPELVMWFKNEYAPLYGGICCSDIIGADLGNTLTRCPEIMAVTYSKTLEILAEYGYIDKACTL